MIFRNSAPILYSSDIKKSIQYYTEVLGFDNEWTWDDEPSFGGVNKDSIQIFFCKNGQGHPGTWFAIVVDNVDELHQRIQTKGGHIVSAPENKEWGLREMLVQDPDGHIIRFGQHAIAHHKSSVLPATINIIDRLPTVEEFEELIKAVGWKVQSVERTKAVLNAPVYAAVAEDKQTNKVIGCVLLLGDGASFYYVKDMMVHPDYQRKQIGTALMQRLNQWLETNASSDVFVGLHTGENLAPFYQQFGFAPAFGMCRRIGKRS
jgi:GNAT superfamily N-acetyltransferase